MGAVDDPPDQLGLAHLIEHGIFDGTDRLGTVDWPAESLALADEREILAALARTSTRRRAPTRRPRWRRRTTAPTRPPCPTSCPTCSSRLARPGLTRRRPETTGYFATLPGNELAPWATAMAEALEHPVFRELATDRTVVEHELELRAP